MSEAHSILSMSDEAFGWYFAGLTDGEGCFSFRYKPDPRNRLWQQFSANFLMGLRDDDADGLTAIAKRFGVGTIRQRTKIFKMPNAKPQCIWDVGRWSDLATVIVPFFERFQLRLKKSRDFLIWKDAVLLMYSITLRPWQGYAGRRGGKRPRSSQDEIDALKQMADAIRNGRQYVPPNVEQKIIRFRRPPSVPLFDLA